MSKLGKDGLLTREEWERVTNDLPNGARCGDCRQVALLAQRDAMLELFEEWVAECPCYVRVRLEERIAALRAGKESNG